MNEEQKRKRIIENYERRLDGLAAIEDDNDKDFDLIKFLKKDKSKQLKILEKLAGKSYWCDKCKDVHQLRDKKYRKHVIYAKNIVD